MAEKRLPYALIITEDLELKLPDDCGYELKWGSVKREQRPGKSDGDIVITAAIRKAEEPVHGHTQSEEDTGA